MTTTPEIWAQLEDFYILGPRRANDASRARKKSHDQKKP